MHTIKEIFNFLDITFAMLWSFTTIDVIQLVFAGGFPSALSTIDNIIKVLFALVGLIYTVLRMHHFYHKSKLERAKLKEEVEKLENENIKTWAIGDTINKN